ncbi:MAG: NADH-quinone oxidoreductase subunit C [Myxococcota bacterium]|nr:NADH-quinone oxidoreductase subunit C [Myxococcota bacterium]
MDDHGSEALRHLIDDLPDAVLETHAQHGDATARVEAGSIVRVAELLRDTPELQFEMLTDLTCVDYMGEEPRFEVVYHFYSVARNHRVRIKARVSESSPELSTLTGLYASADWMEREVFDLYGVRFSGHPDLRRILLYDEFQGHPLRKDYPKERRQPLVGPQN